MVDHFDTETPLVMEGRVGELVLEGCTDYAAGDIATGDHAAWCSGMVDHFDAETPLVMEGRVGELVLEGCTDYAATVEPGAVAIAIDGDEPAGSPPSDPGALMCAAVLELTEAHNQHLPQLGSLNSATYDDDIRESVHVLAILEVIGRFAAPLDSLTYPTDPALLVAVRNAYRSYADGVLAMKALMEREPGEWQALVVPVLDGFASGKAELQAADARLALLEAAGTVDCSAARRRVETEVLWPEAQEMLEALE